MDSNEDTVKRIVEYELYCNSRPGKFADAAGGGGGWSERKKEEQTIAKFPPPRAALVYSFNPFTPRQHSPAQYRQRR